jgi:hypothetical protein
MGETVISGDVRMVLVAMAYLLVKHAIADFLLQTEFQRREKGRYGAPGGLVHCLIHILATAPVFWLLPAISMATAAALLAAEFAIHYHLDWTKDWYVRSRRLTAEKPEYWWALGFDQLLHGLTYVALIWLSCLSAAPG